MILEAWHPVTQDFGLIECSTDLAVVKFVDWQESLGHTFVIRKAESLEAAFEMLSPLSMEKRRCVFVPTTSEWSGFFQSGIDGSDPFPAMSLLCQRLQTRAMRVCTTPACAKYPATIWEVYACEALGGIPPLGYRRSVCAANDGGRWRFEQSGEPFPFEDTPRYLLPKKRERFDRDMLAQYLQHFNLEPLDDGFYTPSSRTPAILLERTTRWQHPPPEFTLREVIDGVPWKEPDSPRRR